MIIITIIIIPPTKYLIIAGSLSKSPIPSS